MRMESINSTIRDLIRDLNDKRLMPVLVVIAVCGVGIPALLMLTAGSSPAGGAPVARAAGLPNGVPSPAKVLADVANSGSTKVTVYKGTEINPFRVTTKGSGSSGGTGSAGTTTPPPPKQSGGSSTSSNGSGGGSKSGGGSSGGGGGGPKPAASGLTSTQTYVTTLNLTLADGSTQQVADAERLTVLPNNSQPEAIYYGVMSGGKAATIVVLPGYKVTTSGTCVPGLSNCELVELPPGTSLQLKTQYTKPQTGSTDSSGSDVNGDPTNPQAPPPGPDPHNITIATSSIRKAEHSSPHAAQVARAMSDATGRALLNDSHLAILALFTYSARDGVVAENQTASVAGTGG